MFRSGGTATTAITGTVAGTTPTPQLASAPVVSPSAQDSAAAWRLPRLNGTTAARLRAGSAAATKRRATKKYKQEGKSQTKGGGASRTARPLDVTGSDTVTGASYHCHFAPSGTGIPDGVFRAYARECVQTVKTNDYQRGPKPTPTPTGPIPTPTLGP